MKYNLTGKCIAGVNGAAKSMKTALENGKKDGSIAESEKQIQAWTAEIGQLVLLELDQGRIEADAVMERYERIQEARQAIAAAETAKQHRKKTCPHCGAKTSTGMRYCGHCGKPLAEDAAEEALAIQ